MALISRGIKDRRAFVSQRNLEPPPRANCRIIAWMTQCIPGGVRFHTRKKYMNRVRKATGIPVGTGTKAEHLFRAVSFLHPKLGWDRYIMPDHSLTGYCRWTDARMMKALASHRVTFSVAVDMTKMPKHLRRFLPTFVGKHQIPIMDARVRNGVQQVMISEVMGKKEDGKPYRGEWVKWSTIRTAMGDAAGTDRVWVTALKVGAFIDMFNAEGKKK